MAARIALSVSNTHPKPTGETPFICALRIYCTYKEEKFSIIEHAMGWINGHASHPMAKIAPDTFVFAADLATAEIQHLQLMAITKGPSMNEVVSGDNGVHAVKDIHMTTNRVPLRAAIDGLQHNTRTPFMGIAFDPVQPDICVVVETIPLPKDLQKQYAGINAKALKRLSEMESKLIPMPQERINQYNCKQAQIAENFYGSIAQQGLKPHPEGILAGTFVSSICNTMMDMLTNLDPIIDEKISVTRASLIDVFGTAAALFKTTGLCPKDKITAAAANACLVNVGPLFSSNYTYASDMKPVINGDVDDMVMEIYEDKNGKFVSKVHPVQKRQGVTGYKLSEDIMIPFSDVYLRQANATLSDLFSGVSADARKGYVNDYYKGDCEDCANFAKTQFELLRRLCWRLSGSADSFYDANPGFQRISAKDFRSQALEAICNHPLAKEWKREQVQDTLRQCAEFGDHIYDTKMKLVLMSAKAANVEQVQKQGAANQVMGHCAAMIVRGKDNTEYGDILTELTAPIRIEVANRPMQHQVGGNLGADMDSSQAELMQDCGLLNTCTNMMAPSKDVKPWLHVGKIDGVFWHVVACVGNVIPIGNSLLGVTVGKVCSASDNKMQGLQVSYDQDEIKEMREIARYALPPIENFEGFFNCPLSPPLTHSFYNQDCHPIVSVCDLQYEHELEGWIKQGGNSRYVVRFGNKAIAVHQMNQSAMKRFQASVAGKNRVIYIKNHKNNRQVIPPAHAQDEIDDSSRLIIMTLVACVITLQLFNELMLIIGYLWPQISKADDRQPPNSTIPEPPKMKTSVAVQKSVVVQTIYKLSGQFGLPIMLLRDWFAYFLIEYRKK
ncbi:hypothetical protein GUITHDRAFT_147761 [Guillardia theta CCMP2712]|uniref:Uncharacterized protein n=1 Tax=Guillardia theta (strain CCMP2712) TaxID=905079 RepID=L1IC06_GUITC|nr:hypothetical protein GUITHDRAFT_147761 [Guillardia theta CCMP2712]EKX33632.1 hypothetical protein GUITHDRAFT_147761 [Guillardia theta CCMP2712]|eukprot:XP_005820612.1 hypothetical protein GUITHDRAFT_147761 [Guillardia theta CCMP2712]